MSKDDLQFSVGDHVVYPAHGVGRVQGIETQEVAGYSLEVYVITFDHGSTIERVHGECFISVADAVDQAQAFRTTWTEEVVRYVIHGILHLRGYDDLEPALRRSMKREENRWVRWVGSRHHELEMPLASSLRLSSRRRATTAP